MSKPKQTWGAVPRHQPSDSEGTLYAPLTQHHVRTSYNADIEAEWTAARTPSGPIGHVRIAMTEASREGRALVASSAPGPIVRPPSTCRTLRGLLKPPPSKNPAAGAVTRPPTARQSSRDAQEAAVVAAKLHHHSPGQHRSLPNLIPGAARCGCLGLAEMPEPRPLRPAQPFGSQRAPLTLPGGANQINHPLSGVAPLTWMIFRVGAPSPTPPGSTAHPQRRP